MDTTQALFAVGILGFLLGVIRFLNGGMAKKVDRTACHEAMKAIGREIRDLKDDTKEIRKDVKTILSKNGWDK